MTDLGTALRSGELAGAAGVHQQTLRYYERRGLLAEPVRSPGGHRLYPPGAVTTLRVIKAAQRLGFTLDEVAELLELGRGSRRRGLQVTARVKLAQIEVRMAELTAVAAILRTAIDAGCDDLASCATGSCCAIALADAPASTESA